MILIRNESSEQLSEFSSVSAISSGNSNRQMSEFQTLKVDVVCAHLRCQTRGRCRRKTRQILIGRCFGVAYKCTDVDSSTIYQPRIFISDKVLGSNRYTATEIYSYQSRLQSQPDISNGLQILTRTVYFAVNKVSFQMEIQMEIQMESQIKIQMALDRNHCVLQSDLDCRLDQNFEFV